MNINRHNYEECFLLYVDNELSAADRTAVEEFVTSNPDLKPELDLLLDTSLLAEPVHFNDKSSLLKPEPVTEAQMENMLLLLDNELSKEDANKITTTIQSTVSLQTEWNILQQTKLDADEKFIFAHKQQLYRREEGKLVSLRIWRMAIAAAVIGIGIFFGISVLQQRETTTPDVAKKQPATPSLQKPVTTIADNQLDTNDTNSTNGDKESLAAVTDVADKNNTIASTNEIANTAVKPANSALSANNNERRQKENVPFENINRQESNLRLATNVEPKTNIMAVEPEKELQIASANKQITPKEIKPLTALDTDIMQPASSPDIRTAALVTEDDPSGNQYLFADEEAVKRSKIGGMLRKVKRTIERNANIKKGNSIQIAGFEIASR